MKKRFLILATLLCLNTSANAADLLEVFEQALISDPIYQQAISQRLSTKEGVPISIASLLPTISLTGNPSVTRSGYTGAFLASFQGVATAPRNTTERDNTITLSAQQTVFNFAQFAGVAGALATSKGADATLNAALQDLMTRVASAYFAVLQDEDNLSYSEAQKLAYLNQLDQVKQQYNVGLKTVTDVYTAQASYDSSYANYIASQNKLANDRENLRVITGKYYDHLSKLSDDFPLISPEPIDVEEWVRISLCQNWSIKASQYNVDTLRNTIRQQFAGHLPTVTFQASADKMYQHSIDKYRTLKDVNGTGIEMDRSIGFNINMPLFSGGSVIAATNQATYNYQVGQQQLEQTIRNTINTTRQSYNSIVAGISQVKADKQAIKSSISSWEGLKASYEVGTQTLVDVLNQQQKVYQAQTAYATDRYAFVNNILALKQAAGTLSFYDLGSINAWLYSDSNKRTTIYREKNKKVTHSEKKKPETKKLS